jgi:hypothetical protein
VIASNGIVRAPPRRRIGSVMTVSPWKALVRLSLGHPTVAVYRADGRTRRSGPKRRHGA